MKAAGDVGADVPIDILESLLRDHLGDETVAITHCTITPFANQGTNDSTTFFCAELNGAGPDASVTSGSARWIVKHWRAGGARDAGTGVSQPNEVLAWEHGLLSPEALPNGVVVPFVGARRSADKLQAWLAMADVSTELAEFPRTSLSADQAISRVRYVLERLAHFHAYWERPERQAQLQHYPWLQRTEVYIWRLAHTYALSLELPPAAGSLPVSDDLPVWDGLTADLNAFLEWLPAGNRRLWQDLMIDRSALVAALASYPRTLLHNDLDDRNIGLRWLAGIAQTGQTAATTPELVLIDWEWIGVGPSVLDVAKVLIFPPVMMAPGETYPETCWTDELPDYYFAHYRAAGNANVDAETWRRAYGLAVVAQALQYFPPIAGNGVRVVRGDVPPPQVVGIPEEVMRRLLSTGLVLLERQIEFVTREARRWLA